jgi:hypothetical protein
MNEGSDGPQGSGNGDGTLGMDSAGGVSAPEDPGERHHDHGGGGFGGGRAGQTSPDRDYPQTVGPRLQALEGQGGEQALQHRRLHCPVDGL